MNRKAYDDEEKNYRIWSLVMPVNREVYVGETIEKGIKDIKHKHLVKMRDVTRSAVMRCREAGGSPELYVIDTLHTTKLGVIERKLVWQKWYEQNGYICLDSL